MNFTACRPNRGDSRHRAKSYLDSVYRAQLALLPTGVCIYRCDHFMREFIFLCQLLLSHPISTCI